MVHKNLKPNNIIINNDNNLILSDIGFSSSLEIVSKLTNEINISKYTSPEVVEDKIQTKSSDIWSFGAIFLELSLGYDRLKDIDYKTLKKDTIIELFKATEYSERMIDFIVNIMQTDAAKRPTVVQILESEWLVGEDKEKKNFYLKQLDLESKILIYFWC